MALHQLKSTQLIPASRSEIWDFISNPANLQRITPKSMGFQILTPELPGRIYPGLMIWYRVKPLLGIPLTWVTEITHVQDLEYFVDEQRKGPYSLWHHEHFIEEVPEGIRMKDIVTYRLPMGILGELAHALFVRKKLKQIFQFREKALIEKYGQV